MKSGQLSASGLTAPARKKLTFAYDAKNRRIAKAVYAWDTGTSTWALTKDVRFVYDGWQMIAELDHTSATGTGLAGSEVDRRFLWGPDLSGSMTGAGGVGGLLSTTYQGVTYQVCCDANGNVTGLVPVSGTGAGTLVARFDYDPFGNIVAGRYALVLLENFRSIGWKENTGRVTMKEFMYWDHLASSLNILLKFNIKKEGGVMFGNGRLS